MLLLWKNKIYSKKIYTGVSCVCVHIFRARVLLTNKYTRINSVIVWWMHFYWGASVVVQIIKFGYFYSNKKHSIASFFRRKFTYHTAANMFSMCSKPTPTTPTSSVHQHGEYPQDYSYKKTNQSQHNIHSNTTTTTNTQFIIVFLFLVCGLTKLSGVSAACYYQHTHTSVYI